jgi:predicted esterase
MPYYTSSIFILLFILTTSLALSDVDAAPWPKLLQKNGTVLLPAQDSPHLIANKSQEPGNRTIKTYITYPGGSMEHVTPQTGLMLSIHNWGGKAASGAPSSTYLASNYNVVAINVDYIQSESRHKDIPYDFGYLQALDCLRALHYVFDGLTQQAVAFDSSRIYSAGGSGGGNVALMANKLAPRTFACIIDLSGMCKLSDDIAFNLPGGSRLTARYSPLPDHIHFLTKDAQALRFVGHPQHLKQMQALGNEAQIVVSHGTSDSTCPIADAREMVTNLQTAGFPVDAHFISAADIDGKVITNTGHSVGNRTLIVNKFAAKYLLVDGAQAATRKGKTDFEYRDELVKYSTPNGTYIISYKQRYPVSRFEPTQQQ